MPFAPPLVATAALYRRYAPMIWGMATDRTAAKTAIADDARVLLGFNEPNRYDQANLSAAQAAALWPKVEAIAASRGAKGSQTAAGEENAGAW